MTLPPPSEVIWLGSVSVYSAGVTCFIFMTKH